MAQYTTILASEYNAMQNKVQDILGTRQGVPSTYGYNNASLITSSNVGVGQQIKQDEWDKLKADLTTLYYYQYGNVSTGLPAIVTGNQIMWSNVVAYQNVTNDMDAKSQAFETWDDGDTFSSYPNLAYTSQAYTYPQGWGGNGASITTIELSGSMTFASRQSLQGIMNAGGYFGFSIAVTGGTSSTSGTKDYYFKQLCSFASNDWAQPKWWSYGGSNGTSNTETETWTAAGQGYSPYGSIVGNLTVRSQLSYNGNNLITFNVRLTDGATGGTSAGTGYPEPAVTADVQVTAFCEYPGGYTPPSGVGVITSTAPTFSGSWSAY